MSVKTLDYTPAYPPYPSLWMGGYGGAPRGNAGQVGKRLRAQCVVIDDGVSTKVMLRVDVVSIPREVHQEIRSLVDPMIGDTADFMMIASHTHSGPFIGTTRPDPYILMGLTAADINAVAATTDVFIGQLVALVQQTINMARTPVTLWYAEGDVVIGYNRADGSAVLDTVPVMVARRTNNNALFAVLFGYACHAVARGNDKVFCSDYPGAATDRITAQLGVPAFFFQGAAGDQDPLDPHQPSQVDTLGNQLGNEVIAVVNNTGLFSEVTGPIVTAYTEVDLPLSVDLGDPAALINQSNRYYGLMGEYEPGSFGSKHAEVMTQQMEHGSVGVPTAMPMPIQRWRMGGLTILALAHEVLSPYAIKLRNQYQGGDLWVMAYANETEGYVAANYILQAGGSEHLGYEAGWIDDDTISGEGTWTTFYAYPAPLKASPDGVSQAVPGTAEHLVIQTCMNLLNS
ncbi:hypothetical protein FKR81_27410 [Lentzea tibetensis]|uniref:Ceramidase n=1 Tax=Lentzea tibetensis TaxID=2591470 RepID=A0A563ENE4_9PSEU|nr:hypothetical protein [Lentzea tibetensis]TWP48655.1 hypothetical protein FKR81_27410 [Lentzea tibetensis]